MLVLTRLTILLQKLEEAADGITGGGGFVNAGGSAGMIKYINSFDGVTLNAAIEKR